MRDGHEQAQDARATGHSDGRTLDLSIEVDTGESLVSFRIERDDGAEDDFYQELLADYGPDDPSDWDIDVGLGKVTAVKKNVLTIDGGKVPMEFLMVNDGEGRDSYQWDGRAWNVAS